MPTAILMVYTPRFFVAVSDGKGSNFAQPALHEQKVFNLNTHTWALMYGVSGAASVLGEDRKTDILKQEYQSILAQVATQEFASLADYANEVVNTLGPALHRIFKDVAPLEIGNTFRKSRIISEFSSQDISKTFPLWRIVKFLFGETNGASQLPTIMIPPVRAITISLARSQSPTSWRAQAASFVHTKQQVLRN